jgi:phospholipid/cholesterol/gamma-HCH transport system substrate-binding protein
MNDRLLGYIVISALFLFLILPVSFLIWKTVLPLHSYLIEFSPINSISFVNFQDPVYVKGVEVGRVRSVVNANEKVYTTIETKEKLSFYNDYMISVIPKGIMGDRYLEIEPGTSASGLLSKDTLQGTFFIGPAEAIGYVDILRSKINQLSELMERLKNGTIENKSLIMAFWQSMETFDSLSSSISVITGTLQNVAEQKLDSIVGFFKESADATMKVSELLPSFLQKVEILIVQSNQLVNQLKSISDRSIGATDKLQNPDLIIWSKKLKILQNELKKAVQVIDELEVEGLKVPIRLSGQKNKPAKVQP